MRLPPLMWTTYLRHRGIAVIELVIHDAHAGLTNAIRHQRKGRAMRRYRVWNTGCPSAASNQAR